MARGLAYGTQSDHHVLNVPAGRMSAFEDDPDSFVRFVQERGVGADGGAFVSRHLYGAYLVWLLTTAAARAAHVVFERVHDEAVPHRAGAGRHACLDRDGARRSPSRRSGGDGRRQLSAAAAGARR